MNVWTALFNPKKLENRRIKKSININIDAFFIFK